MALTQQLYETMREMTLVSLSPDNSVHFAEQIMSEYRADVVLLKRRGCVVGMLTYRDLAARVRALGRDPEITALSAVMTATGNAKVDEDESLARGPVSLFAKPDPRAGSDRGRRQGAFPSGRTAAGSAGGSA